MTHEHPVASASDKRQMRKRLFVDPKVQGSLIARAVLYWIVCLLTMTLLLLCWRIITGPARAVYTHFDDMWFHYGPPLVASFVLLPLVVLDMVRLSNRFVGPMLRLRRSMRELAAGMPVERLEFRDGDFWHDFAKDFNTLVDKVESLERAGRGPKDDVREAQRLVASAVRD